MDTACLCFWRGNVTIMTSMKQEQISHTKVKRFIYLFVCIVLRNDAYILIRTRVGI